MCLPQQVSYMCEHTEYQTHPDVIEVTGELKTAYC